MKKLPRWMEPVYITQVLTGLAGIGAILISDNITKWHALVVGVIGCSLITSLIVSARAEADSQRSKKHVETLLRAMELPYFIIHALTPLIESSAKAKGWSLTRQENFRDETVYEFQSTGNERGRLVISEQEFKDLWVLEDIDRLKAIENRLFGVDSLDVEHLATVIREAIGEQTVGPCRIIQETAPDGAQVFSVTTQCSGSAVVQLSALQLRELFAMPPIRRYHAAAKEVMQALASLRP